MSESQLTPDDIERLKSRDRRFSVLAQAIAIEQDLRDSPAIKAIMAAVRADADQAMEELADTSPHDTVTMSLHLVKIKTLVYMRRTLNTILRQGSAAEAAIRAEDARESDE